jgi:hypothetical protein
MTTRQGLEGNAAQQRAQRDVDDCWFRLVGKDNFPLDDDFRELADVCTREE